MSSRSLVTLFAVPFTLAALLALPSGSFAQDEGGEDGAGEVVKPAEPAPETPKAEEPAPEVKGNRYRITLRSDAKIEGLLPQGLVWEKRDQFGEFVEATETEKGAGLRLNFVLNMEGDIFIEKKDIKEVKDLGALTPEQRLAIQETVLAAKRKSLAEREKINREELAKLAAEAQEAEAKEAKDAEGEARKDGEAGKKLTKEEKDRKRGDELLKKFPSDQWGAKRIEEIQRRSVINGIFPSTDEQEFIDNFDLWKDAVARRDKAEAEGGGEGSGGEGGTGKDTPPPEEPPTSKDKKGKEKVPPAEFKKKGE